MLVQILIGSGLMLTSVLAAGISLWLAEWLLGHTHGWLTREPHRPKLLLLLSLASVWILGVVTSGVWIWALAFWSLGVFPTLEGSVYFALVVFTTLGFGDVLLPTEWRLLAGMAAANGLLSFGLMTAVLVEVLRHIRLGQIEKRRGR